MTYVYTLSDIDAAERSMEEHLLKVAVKAVADQVVLFNELGQSLYDGPVGAYSVLYALVEDIYGLHGPLNSLAVIDTARRMVREQLIEMKAIPSA